MAENTKIEWADHTFNPWIGCTKVGPGCDHCYAEAWDRRFALSGHDMHWGAGKPRKLTADSTWALPLRWNREAERLGVRYRVFCASMADVFDNEVPTEWRISLLKLITQTPHLDWLLLTKRIGNAAHMLEELFGELEQWEASWMTRFGPVLPNVWIGATIVNQTEADRDIPKLLAVPAAKRFLSMEPLLGPVDLRFTNGLVHGCDAADYRLDWVIVGGESGSKARPMHPDWARSLRDQCQAAGVPFLFKQWGEWAPSNTGNHARDSHRWQETWPEDGSAKNWSYLVGKKAAGRLLDGREWNEVPDHGR